MAINGALIIVQADSYELTIHDPIASEALDWRKEQPRRENHTSRGIRCRYFSKEGRAQSISIYKEAAVLGLRTFVTDALLKLIGVVDALSTDNISCLRKKKSKSRDVFAV